MMRRVIALLFLLLAAHFAALPQIAVEVHVANSLTNAPIPGANVVFVSSGDDRVSGRTDAAGVFTAHLASGKYLLNVTRRGYVMKNGAMGEMVSVTDGQSPVIAELNPLGIVAGRVLDQFGDPVRGAVVHLEDETDFPGQEGAWESRGSAFTNDLGEYRVAEVPAGEHHVLIEYQSGGPRAPVARGSRLHWSLIGGLAFYPDASSIEQSQKIAVAAGAVTRLNDARISVRPAVTIAGRITPAPAIPNNTLVSLESTSKIALHSSAAVQAQQIDAKGEFHYEALPGTYKLSAFDTKTGKVSQPITITAETAPVTGIELGLTSSYDITGRITVESKASLDFSKLVLTFGDRPMRIESDGSFHTTVPGRKAYLNLQNLPEGWYMKSALVRGKPVRGNQFEVEAGSNEVLVSVSSGGARVQVVVRAPDSMPEEVFVLLIPEGVEPPALQAFPNDRGTTSEPIEFHSLRPGTYRIFALDAAAWAMMMRPDILMTQYKNDAPAISVAEGESKTAAVSLMRIGIPQ